MIIESRFIKLQSSGKSIYLETGKQITTHSNNRGSLVIGVRIEVLLSLIHI